MKEPCRCNRASLNQVWQAFLWWWQHHNSSNVWQLFSYEDFHLWVFIIIICFKRRHLTTSSRQFQSVEKFFLEKYQAVLPTLYQLKRGLSSFRSAQENMIAFNSPDPTGRITIMDSRALHVDHIHDLTLRLLHQANKKTDELLFHHPQFSIPDDTFIHDDPCSLHPGYGFVHDERNFWTAQPTVLQYILTTPHLLEKFAYFDGRGDMHWKPGAVHARMVEIYNLQMDLFILILFTFGAPARGTELLSHLILNVSGGSIRNIFVLFNIFTLRGSYNKTSHALLKHRSMVRIPLLGVGRLVIRFLVFLRPTHPSFRVWGSHSDSLSDVISVCNK